MPKIVFTPELADTLKAIRVENKVPAKEVAAAIGHSPSYVSKLENYGIKTLPKEEFDQLLEAIIKDAANAEERKEQLLSLYSIRYSKEEREEQLWYLNLDTVERILPIPPLLVAEVMEMLTELGISISALVDRINSNEELDESTINDDKVPTNVWFEISDDPETKHSIKMHLDEQEVEGILSGKITYCNYVTILAIVHYTLKCAVRDSGEGWTKEELFDIAIKQRDFLDKHKFYTMTRKAALLSRAHSELEVNGILNEFDLKTQELTNTILKYLRVAADLNVMRANKILEQLGKNFEWDFNFMLQLASVKFESIGECSFSNKNQLLKEIRALVGKYRDMPEEEKKVDTYEYDTDD